MRDYSTVHPELQASLKITPTLRVGRGTLWFFRAALRVLPPIRPMPPWVSVHDETIVHEQEGHAIRLRIYRPSARAEALPALLWIHGGGYVMGRPETDDPTCAEYACELGIVVVSVDYRLAPRHPFPAALHDCLAAFTWLHAKAGELGVDAAHVAVGGASAGGGLAAALAQLVSDRAEAPCAFQLLVYPMLDDRTSRHAAPDDDAHFLWTKSSNRFGWQAYLGASHLDEAFGSRRPADAPEPPAYAVPARRKSLAGLPPAWIGVGTADLFHDEDVAYAQRLKESGVDCELCVVSGAYHGFDVTSRRPPLIRHFVEAQLAALKKHLF